MNSARYSSYYFVWTIKYHLRHLFLEHILYQTNSHQKHDTATKSRCSTPTQDTKHHQIFCSCCWVKASRNSLVRRFWREGRIENWQKAGGQSDRLVEMIGFSFKCSIDGKLAKSSDMCYISTSTSTLVCALAGDHCAKSDIALGFSQCGWTVVHKKTKEKRLKHLQKIPVPWNMLYKFNCLRRILTDIFHLNLSWWQKLESCSRRVQSTKSLEFQRSISPVAWMRSWNSGNLSQ